MKVDKILEGLEDIQECMNNGMYDLDSGTEDEMIESGCINNYVEVQKDALEEAIKVLKIARGFYPPINFE